MGLPSAFVFVVVCLAIARAQTETLNDPDRLKTDPDTFRTGPELITSKGYPFEEHFVTTSDTFILRMFRIPHGRFQQPSAGRPVVFLQHGILDSADTWILNSAETSLAFMLADAGFDVFLGNNRGNKYSRNSTTLSPNWPFDSAFWDFSYADLGLRDLPAQVGKALEVANATKLVYIGHSQGTTQAFAALSSGVAADQISLFVALAPVSWLGNCQSLLLKLISDFSIDQLVKVLGIKEFLGTSEILRLLLPTVCTVTPALCESMIYILTGLDQPNLNRTRLEVYMAHFPSGTSAQALSHYAQSIRRNTFEMYDYGSIINTIKYKQPTPPIWDLAKMRTPTALFWGDRDFLGDPKDVANLISHLPPEIIAFTQELPEYDHLSFVWGMNTYKEVYGNVIDLARRYSVNSTVV